MANTPNVPKSNKISSKFLPGLAGWVIIATAVIVVSVEKKYSSRCVPDRSWTNTQTIGTSRETVTALLSRFVTLGAITPIGDGYRIVDEDLLDDIANGDLPVSPRHPVNVQPSTMIP